MHSQIRTPFAHRWQKLLQPALALRAWRAVLFLMVLSALAWGLCVHSTQAAASNLLTNGSFEQGFVEAPGCGLVGVGWNCFTNRGAATYGFYADQWAPVVAAGAYSQLIEINTYRYQVGADNDRYAGLSQSVQVTPGASYRLSLHGMIRTTNLNAADDIWRYRVQVGYLDGSSTDWRAVHNWSDVGWDTYYGRTAPGVFSDYQRVLTPTTNRLTLFIRVWKKWGLPQQELDVNLDAIALEGPLP